ncbi:hypothetical protein OnM2_015042 [Erysiphe neolycopersici]|uniref:G-patch domain-containing protein n=1 Tax=Erysiphe neolycopersici TaxID=212602 RepID=A0A420I5H9_9PEZI|nr:hypothetical protein OnM2_015042 [Erysiphe neolycopersici]
MDAHALLTKQGWRGTGNSLHPTSNSIGLAKPLLVGRKNDKVGLGKKVHQTSDMWWMHAFDESLKALDTTHEGTSIKSLPSSGGLEAIKRGAGKWILANGGLYANFVKGTGLAGTMLQVTNKNTSTPIANPKQKSSDKNGCRKAKKHLKSTLQEQISVKRISESDDSRIEKPVKCHKTKEERKARKAERRLLRKESGLTSIPLVMAEDKKMRSLELATIKNSHEESLNDESCETLHTKKKRRK